MGSLVRIQYRPLFHFAGFCTESQGLAQLRKAQGVEFQIARMCKQVRLGAAPHFAPRMHRFLHRLFSRLSLRLQRVSLFPCAESNHPFQLLLEHANLYVSNNGELLLKDYDPATMRLDARDNHQPNLFHRIHEGFGRVEAKACALLSQLFCGMKSEDFRSSPQALETTTHRLQLPFQTTQRESAGVLRKQELFVLHALHGVPSLDFELSTTLLSN